jgi:hypothetical protein
LHWPVDWQIEPSLQTLPTATPAQQAKFTTPQHCPVAGLQLALPLLNHALHCEESVQVGTQ